jgi:methyl-accepting chemotaxis protein
LQHVDQTSAGDFMTPSPLSVKAKLAIAFGGITALLLLVAGLAWRALDVEEDSFDNYINGINTRATVASQVRQAVDARAIAARNMVIAASDEEVQREHTKAVAAHQQVAASLDKLQKLAEAPGVPAQVKDMIGRIAGVEQKYAPVALNIVNLALQHKRDDAIQRMNEQCRPLLAELTLATDAYAAATAERAKQLLAESDARGDTQRSVFIAVTLLALLMATVSGVLLTRSLTRALGAEPAELNAAATKVAQGDLSPVAGIEQAPAGSVLACLDLMRGNLVKIVQQVRDASDSIAMGSTQIASGNADLSQRTEEQASALQQTAATMDELGATVRNNADQALQASELARNANTIVTQGGAVMADVVATMRDIDQSSSRIADIIGTIDGIAFQTNILALNAAVEAARAGEQGRGFAVVAGEVRLLAQRSAEAAKEIKSLIASSVEQVEKGSVLVDRAGTTMQDVVGAIQRVSSLVDAISSASREQSTGVGQVGEAVQQMDQVTQQNAALVEESAAAAESLRQQAAQLVTAVAVFTMDGAAGAARPVAMPAPSASAARPKPRAPAQLARTAKPRPVAPLEAAGEWSSF